MAVVCRSGAAVADLADLLSRTGLPVRVPRRPQPLREVPAIADLLRILEIGLAPQDAPLDPRLATELLRGPFGDADTLRLRRIRRLLLGAHRAAEPDSETPSEQLLARALVDEEVPGLPAPEARDRAAAPIHRVREMIHAVREHPEADAQQVLWHAWNASGLAGGWRRGLPRPGRRWPRPSRRARPRPARRRAPGHRGPRPPPGGRLAGPAPALDAVRRGGAAAAGRCAARRGAPDRARGRARAAA